MLEGLNLREVSIAYWTEIAKKCRKAVVFIDNAAAECLHWCGGIKLLSTAAQLREFSSFESASSDYKKAVFIINNPALCKQTHRTLRMIIEASSFEYCMVITWTQRNVIAVTRHPARDFNIEDRSGNEWLEDSLLGWMGNLNFTAEVYYYPIFMVSLSPKAFLTPAYSGLMPLLPDDVDKCSALWKILNPGQQLPQSSGECNWTMFPHELQSVIRQLVTNLHGIFLALGIKEDIFSIGPFAKAVGDQLESWGPARNRRTSANRGSASLILVDRTFDLAGPAISANESVFGKLLESHTRMEGHTVDVNIDLGDLLGITCKEMFVPANIASPDLNTGEDDELETLLFGSDREVMSLLHLNLLKGSPKKTGADRKRSLITATLENDLKDYDMDHEAIFANLSTVSKCRALLTSQDSESQVKRKRLQSLASQFGRDLILGGGRPESVLVELTELIRSRHDARLRIRDILALLVFTYSSVHPSIKFREEDEERLKSVLGEALLVEGKAANLGPELMDMFQQEGEGNMDELVALNVVNKIWTRLEGLAMARSCIQSHQSLIDDDGHYVSFLQSLLKDVYSESRSEVADLHHHSGGLGALLRTGLGWLGGNIAAANKIHPRHNPWVIVFVIGGITPGEIKHLQKVVEGTDSKLTVGGTRILTASDSINILFNNNPLMTHL